MCKIIKAGTEENFEKNIMAANVNVGDICNFSCSYCINPSSKNKLRRILDKDILNNFIDDIAEKNCDMYQLSVAGGEPLIYPHINFLVEKFDQTISCPNKHISFATNGSLLLEKGEQLYKAAKNTKLSFSISVHTQQININEFANDIANFGHRDDIKCKILFYPNKFDEMKHILSVLKKNNIPTFITPIAYTEEKPYSYSDEEIAFMNKYQLQNGKYEVFNTYLDGLKEYFWRVSRVLHPEKRNYQGMYCTAGFNKLRLAPDGTCARCLGFLKVGEKFDLSKQRLRDIPELSKPCVCPFRYCACLTFLQAAKWRNSEDMPNYLRRPDMLIS